jgi:hypothetical protein
MKKVERFEFLRWSGGLGFFWKKKKW